MRTCYQSVASHGVIRPRFAEKVYFILLFAHFVLVHVIKRISNEFSFHTMYYETRCVFYIPSPEARGYKTHNSFHNTSYGMKIHLRSYISFHLIFLRKVDGCWSLVSIHHIIHKFVNVYPYIAYSC